MHLMHSCWPHATVRSWGRRRLQPRKEQHCLTQHKRSTGLGREQKQGAPVDGVDGDGGREAGEQHGLAALVGALGGGREDAAQAHVLHLLRSGSGEGRREEVAVKCKSACSLERPPHLCRQGRQGSQPHAKEGHTSALQRLLSTHRTGQPAQGSCCAHAEGRRQWDASVTA